jgi:ribosomal protein S18 acetylase RimI-like enzyme
VKELIIRFSEMSDAKYMIKWLDDEKILHWFPMSTKAEIEDSVNVCMGYVKYKAILTAEYKKVPCGIACLYLQGFKKFAHQCLFVIVLDQQYRQKGIGTELMKELMVLAKERFGIEILHLEVYDTNPAVSFYEKLGFVKYGYQKNFVKEKDGSYLGKILMEKRL